MCKVLLTMKKILKTMAFDFFDRLLNSPQCSDIAKNSLVGCLRSKPELEDLSNDFSPYSELGGFTQRNYSQKKPIFITGRFRSGSTLLWNIFRHIEGITSYYEPLNERRWFDPSVRGDKVDPTHVNVDTDYWREYEGLRSQLGHLYSVKWIDRDLYMDDKSSNWDLQRYLDALIRAAPDKAVLQFNRADFRLAWLKYNFPKAKFVHIYRHPRDQWISTLMDSACFGPDSGDLSAFQNADKFYLRMWVRDLQHWFPFLKDWSRHPYYHFYFLWKLSFLFGQNYCQHSIKFENLVTKPRSVLEPLFSDLDIEEPPWDRILSVISTPKMGKWNEYASESWFQKIEYECEQEMQLFFGWEK